MPMYEFTVPADNEVVEVFLSMADFDKRVIDGKITLDDGREAVYEWQQHNKMRSVPANYPMVCDFVGFTRLRSRNTWSTCGQWDAVR
jgi:hypothetical protein